MEKSTFETRGRIVELEIRDNEPVGEGVRVCKDCLAVVLCAPYCTLSGA